MNSEIKEGILDAYDSVMDSFYKSSEYQQQRTAYNAMYYEFKSELTPEQCTKFISILNARGDLESMLVLEAFYRGFVNGTEMHKDAK